jgi:Mg-chelatase subunit ChlD
MRRLASLLALAVLVVLGVLGAVVTRRAQLAVAAAPEQGALAYRLVADWTNVPWQLTAGRYGEAVDISSAPDGNVYVLDRRHGAVHVVDADGSPRRVFLVPGLARPYVAQSLDVAVDGTLWVLTGVTGRGGGSSQVSHLSPDGVELGSFGTGEEVYGDIAVRSDGRLYLTRARDSDLLHRRGVDVYDEQGKVLETISPLELDLPRRVDVAADGTVYILQDIFVPAAAPPPPGPRPTPGPSGPMPASVGPRQDVQPVAGVVIVSGEHQYRETVPFEFGLDVAVGPSGVYVSRYGEVYGLRANAPLSSPIGQRWSGALALDVMASGRLLASVSHCNFQGVLGYNNPLRPGSPWLKGQLDRPELEGPVYPIRVAADSDVMALQGSYQIEDDRPLQSYFTNPVERQSVQRWQPDGSLVGQLGLCTTGGESGWTRDVAVDGPDVYTVDAGCVERRPDDQFPEWAVCTEGSWGGSATANVVAVSATNGRVAVLDTGSGGVLIVGRDGKRQAAWRLAGGGVTVPPVDLALTADRVFVAELGRRRVAVYGLDGTDLGGFNVADAPQALAVSPSGDVVVLGRGGWGYRYTPTGGLMAAWPMPDPFVQARDVAVDRQDRVIVSYVGLRDPEFGGVTDITSAGLWVFAPEPATSPPVLPADGACVARPDKRAAPARLPLGAEVAVTLDVTGSCPPAETPVQLALVVDVSRSMNWRNAFRDAQQAVLQLVAQLDPRVTEVTLVTFADAPALAEPLGRDLASVARHVVALQTNGDTLMAAGIDLAMTQLTGPGRDRNARQIIVLVTDGVPKDPFEVPRALEAATDERIELNALIFESGQRASLDLLDQLMAKGGNVLYDPGAVQLRSLANGFVQTVPREGLFDSITVTDEIPTNMRFVPGSAQPPATLTGQTLAWTLPKTDSGMELTYRLVPQQAGIWPTNVRADADYVDVMGQAGQLVFPVPTVEVIANAERVYLPILLKGSCVRRVRPVDVVLVLDSSDSMAAPAVGGGTKLEAAREAARGFLALLALPYDRAGIVSFNAGGKTESALTGDAAALGAALDRLASSPGTRIDLGLAAAGSVMSEGRRPEAKQVIVLLTDGRQNGDVAPVLRQAEALKSAGATMYAIGLGTDVDGALLRQLASAPEAYFDSPTEPDLQSIYAQISERLACGNGP